MWVCLCVLERGRENVSHFSTLARSYWEECSVLIGSNRAGSSDTGVWTWEPGLSHEEELPSFLPCSSANVITNQNMQITWNHCNHFSSKLKIYKNEEFNILCWNYLLETFGKVLCSSLCLMQECCVCVVKRAYIVSLRLFPCFWQRLLTIPLRQMSYIRLWLLLLM